MSDSILFTPGRIGTLELANRFVRSATGEGFSEGDGIVTKRHLRLYEELAAGGVGLIITGHMFVLPEWRCGEKQTGVSGPEHLPGLMRLASACKAGVAKTVVQINYVGREPADMAEAEISEAIDAFAAAAERVMAAGFDGVQIHAAHGFLVSHFLSPARNARTDGWGGSPEGRRRLVCEIARAVRGRLGPDAPVLAKLGAVDGIEGGLAVEESVQTARELVDAGVDGIEVSCGFSGPLHNAAATKIDAPI